MLLFIIKGSSASAQPDTKNILLLFSFSNRADYVRLNILKSELRAHIPYPLNFYVEYLEGRRFDNEGYEEELVRTLGQTYRGEKLDLVLIQSYTGLQFVMRHRGALFPEAPIIFLDVDPGQIAGVKMWPGVTGVTAGTGIRETIDLALHLHPNTDAVAVIIAKSTPDKYFLSRMQTELSRYQGKVREVDLVGLPLEQLRRKIASLPRQTVVLFDLAPEESVQPAIGAKEMLEWIAQRLPTYGIFPGDVLAHGGIGGVGYDWRPELALVADEATRVLSGERPENVPLVNYANLHAQVDWRAMQRWHIPESALPAGSVIVNRPPSFLEQYRRYVIATVTVIAVLLLLIVGLLWERTRKRKVEAALHESEKRFQMMADTTPSLVWMCDPQGKITYLNDKWFAFTGTNPDTGYDDSWVTYVHPDDLKNVLDVFSHALKVVRPFSQECRLRRSDGIYRWILSVASPRVNGDGSFAGFIGSAIDTTDQKLASQALEKVSGQLIEAQEKERSRIARDLHDDICQRLALLSMELDRAGGSRDGSSGTTKENLEMIRKHCSEIADDVQSLSHQLHSSKLELLGIAAAIKGFCKEFSKRHEVNIEFTDRDVPQYLPKDISLCLFRVTQEALHNAMKYSGTSNFTVQIHATAHEVQLAVSDSGAGFDVEEATMNQGLGLVSMQERVHLVHGKLLIESELGKGTKILALVPTVTENQNAFEDRTARQAEHTKEVA